MITSTKNPQIKYIEKVRKKSRVRKNDKVFLVEGERIFRETPKDRIKKVYISESLFNEKKELVDGVCFEVLEDGVFEKAADTIAPQGIMAIVRQEETTREEVLKEKNPLYIVLDGLQDPGNLGTIMRTAEGAGVSAVIMSSDTVDIYNPKVIRSTMGSIYRVPFLIEEDIISLLEDFKKCDITSYAAHLDGEDVYEVSGFDKGVAFLIGNEGNGLSMEVSQRADKLIKIPMQGKLESLNAAMASGLLVYEVARQRRNC